MSTWPDIVLTTGEFSFSRKDKVLRGFSESFGGGFPPRFRVKSDHTGQVVEFRHIGQDHPRFDPDHWDGEQAIYEPVQPQRNVKLCIITHAY